MIESSGQIRYRRLKEGGYQLLDDAWIMTSIVGCAAQIKGYVYLDQDGKLTAERGYRWDGASGPAIDRKANMRAGLFHDCLYQLHRTGKLPSAEFRIHSDELFRQLYLDDSGVTQGRGLWLVRLGSRFMATLDYLGLRWFAGHAAARKPEVEVRVLVAP